MTSLDDVIDALAAWRDRGQLYSKKVDTLHEYAQQTGMTIRQLAERLPEECRKRGWTDEQIAQAGISYGTLRRILEGG